MTIGQIGFEFSILDRLRAKGICFAIYRFPDTNNIQIVIQASENPQKIVSYEDIGKQSGFILAPFRISDNSPILVIKPDIFYTDLIGEETAETAITNLIRNYVTHSSPRKLTSKTDSRERYKKAFEAYKKELKEKHFKKLVLARLESVPYTEKIVIGKLFEKAINNNPHHFVSLCHTPESGTWLSISPEILLKQKDEQYETIALAGTRSIGGGEWDVKNKEEQKIVADYMKQQLEKSGLTFTESKPHTFPSGNIEHIKTSFSFTDNDRKFSIGDLLNLLHPSPAVCGYPKQEAYTYICNHEGFDRSYYSGFLGPVNLYEQSRLYVNLRCAQIDNGNLTFYAGGGIMPESEFEKEWNETNNKMVAVKSLL